MTVQSLSGMFILRRENISRTVRTRLRTLLPDRGDQFNAKSGKYRRKMRGRAIRQRKSRDSDQMTGLYGMMLSNPESHVTQRGNQDLIKNDH